MGEGMKVTLFAVGIPVCAILFVSITRFAKEKSVWRFLQLLGAVCLLMMVLVHVAEAFTCSPGMNWGRNNSAGHYLDLFSAIMGLVLLRLGYLLHVLMRRSSRRLHANRK
jgi:formate hydrogenlyase subunit 3/multisubunit Na+/H+ antiporter MnhD subunit